MHICELEDGLFLSHVVRRFPFKRRQFLVGQRKSRLQVFEVLAGHLPDRPGVLRRHLSVVKIQKLKFIPQKIRQSVQVVIRARFVVLFHFLHDRNIARDILQDPKSV